MVQGIILDLQVVIGVESVHGAGPLIQRVLGEPHLSSLAAIFTVTGCVETIIDVIDRMDLRYYVCMWVLVLWRHCLKLRLLVVSLCFARLLWIFIRSILLL